MREFDDRIFPHSDASSYKKKSLHVVNCQVIDKPSREYQEHLHVGIPSGDYRERKFRPYFTQRKEELKKEFMQSCEATKEETASRGKLHIVSHTCAFGPSLKANLECMRNRFRNTRSAIICMPGEITYRDELTTD